MEKISHTAFKACHKSCKNCRIRSLGWSRWQKGSCSDRL